MKQFCVAGLLVVLAAAVAAPAGTVHDDLQLVLSTKGTGEFVSALVYLNDAVDLDALNATLDGQRATLQQRHETVVLALQARATATQKPVLALLEKLQAGGLVQSYKAFWIANVISIEATRSAIDQLAAHPSVDVVYLNYPVALIEPVESRPASTDGPETPEPGIIAIRAPECWAIGITGAGVLVSTMDTGVDGTHPALASRWAGLLPQYVGHPQWAWRDAIGGSPNFPTDTYGHGTHTMGTVCGLAGANQIGVAPGAHWIADNAINQGIGQPLMDDIIADYQWFADPDGDPNTNWDVPATNSNSWGIATSHNFPPWSTPCNSGFWAAIDALEAVGCVVLYSAGNEGPGANTLRRPADRGTDAYRNLAVAAVDANTTGWPIASFSSRGPTNCGPNGESVTKPEMSAPGVNVRSSYPGGGYQYMDGTSMASPHINGVCALLRQACPGLTVTQIKEILYQTAHDLGTAGKDNSYGWGMVDAYAAVLLAQDMCQPHPPHANDGSAATTENIPVTVTLQGTDDGLPDPPATLSYVIVSRPAHGILSDPQGGLILTTPYTLLNYGNHVIYRPNPYYNGNDAFTFVANDGGDPPLGGDSNVATVTVTVGGPVTVYSWNLDTFPGWTAEAGWAYGQPTAGSGDHGFPDPNSGHTGTRVYGYNLGGGYINNWPERALTTTPINCTGLHNTSLAYWRWLGVQQSSHDHAYVRISNDGGATWTNIWQNPDTTIDDHAWVHQEIDIAAYADNQPNVKIRWVMGPTDSSWTYCGWNLDDLEIRQFLPNNVRTGDLNCDGVVNFDDIDPFVLILSDQATWQAQYPGCDWRNGDCNGDGAVNFDDINGFVAVLSQ